MTLYHDSIGQPISLRDVVVNLRDGQQSPQLVTKFTPKQIRLGNGGTIEPTCVIVITAQVDAFDPTIRTKLIDKYDRYVDEAPPVITRKVRYMIKHMHDYGGKPEDGSFQIIRLEFADAAERDRALAMNALPLTTGRTEGVLIAGNRNSRPHFSRSYRYSVNALMMSERTFCEITSLEPGIYDMATWKAHLVCPEKIPFKY